MGEISLISRLQILRGKYPHANTLYNLCYIVEFQRCANFKTMRKVQVWHFVKLTPRKNNNVYSIYFEISVQILTSTCHIMDAYMGHF